MIFRGRFEYAIDPKGRVNIPAPFRERLQESGQESFVLTNFAGCLYAFPADDWARIEERLSQVPSTDRRKNAFASSAPAWRARSEPDSIGRCSACTTWRVTLLSPFLSADPPVFPFVALLVSGGHTQLMRVDAVGRYRLLGETIDDAAGEAFDKTAKLMGLPYPGGPVLAKLAARGRASAHPFPRPMTDRPGFDFSFSGLKTAALLAVTAERDAGGKVPEAAQCDIAASFQEAVVDTLAIKCRRALEATGRGDLVVAGGVSANLRLREQLDAMAKKLAARVHYPRFEFCSDNGAMIAFAGAQRLL